MRDIKTAKPKAKKTIKEARTQSLHPLIAL